MIHSQEIHTEIKLSRSVVDALNNLRPEPKPSAIEIIREIIKIHEELAKKEGKELINKVILDATSEEPSVDPITVSVTLGQRKEVGEWIKELSSLYVKEKDKVPQLHVRLFIIGLCLTDYLSIHSISQLYFDISFLPNFFNVAFHSDFISCCSTVIPIEEKLFNSSLNSVQCRP